MNNMRIVHISAKLWKSRNDFYDSIFNALSIKGEYVRDLNSLSEYLFDDEMVNIEPMRVYIDDAVHVTSEVIRCIAADLYYILQARDNRHPDFRKDINIIMEI